MTSAVANNAPAATKQQHESVAASEDDGVVMVCEGADFFILERAGMKRVPDAAIQRSSILAEMKDAPGASNAPVSKRSFLKWMDLVAEGADCSAWMQAAELRDVAEVAEFLKDGQTVRTSTTRLGQLLHDLVHQNQPTSEFLQDLAGLDLELLTMVFTATDHKLSTLLPLMPPTPPSMAVALLRRHLQTVSDSLDISEQLLDADTTPASDGPGANTHFQTIANIMSSMEPLRHLAARSVGLGAADVPSLSDALPQHSSRLCSLDISNNPIGASGATALAPFLAHLSHLTLLDMSGCGITARSAPRALAPALRAMPGLRHVDLSNNRLSDLGMRVLCPVLWQLTGLEELRLARNSLSRSFEELAPAVARMHALRLLDVSENRGQWVAVAAMVGAAARLPCLEELNVSQALLLRPRRLNLQANADEEMMELFSAAHHAFWNAHAQGPPADPEADPAEGGAPESDSDGEPAPDTPPAPLPEGTINLGILPGSITGNLMTGKAEQNFPLSSGAGSPPPAEPVPTAPLKRLHMRTAAIHPNLLQRLCCALKERFVHSTTELARPSRDEPTWTVVQHLQQLESLDLSDIPIGGGPIMQLFPLLMSLRGLRELRVANCDFPGWSLDSLCRSFTASGIGVTLLDWSGNSIVNGERRDVLKGVETLPTLRDLRLRHCGIGGPEAAALADGVRQLGSLRRLDLARNGLGGEGAAAVVAAVAQLPDMAYMHCGAAYGVDAEAARAQLPPAVVFEVDE
eukprot:jgi/Ulvmu1/1353/UM011_0081.1